MRSTLATFQRHGVDFEQAWEKAWRRIRWPHPTPLRREWKRALAATRPTWARAYEGDLCPTGSQMAVLELVA
jgi:hypothetical protein